MSSTGGKSLSESAQQLSFRVSQIFTPAAPISTRALFAGRQEQLLQVVDAINQPGQHAILFGERGVGKTSLANMLRTHVVNEGGTPIVAARVNCVSSHTYSTVWRAVIDEIELQRHASKQPPVTAIAAVVPADCEITPDIVRRALTLLSTDCVLIVIVDEFDRLQSSLCKALFADTVKMLSDHVVPATLVLVGVADSAVDLIAEHQSIERALVQVQMPRMSADELNEIVQKGLELLNMGIDAGALRDIARLSKGFPHYTHLIALHATREAIDEGSKKVLRPHLDTAVRKSLEKAQESIRTTYQRATISQRSDNLYAEVLLACALARTADPLGWFQLTDVREPLSRIRGKLYEIPSFSRHIYEFCEDARGPVLQKCGSKNRFRFRFHNPLMQPFVTMKALNEGSATRELIEAIEQSASLSVRRAKVVPLRR
jgi:Cdc6-like AAA superfamily ATPase